MVKQNYEQTNNNNKTPSKKLINGKHQRPLNKYRLAPEWETDPTP